MSHIPLYALWVQTAAFLATLIGLSVTVTWNIRIAWRRATLDILLQEQSVESLIKERTRFNELLNAGSLVGYADDPQAAADPKQLADDVAVIRSSMNRYELIALGIRNNAVDGRIYKGWCRTTLVGEWIACRPLVLAIRARHNVATYAIEFEHFAKTWATKSELPYC